MNIWAWLQSNSAPLQSIAALILAVLTFVTIWVLIVTWRAIKRQAVASELQAKASRALMGVAEQQTKATQAGAAAAQRQADLVAAQTEMSIAPLLVAEVDEANPIAGHKSYRLFNRGQGIAFQVHYWEGHVNARFSSRTIRSVHPPTIGPGASAQVVIDGRLETWTARYKGIDDQERWLMVYLDDDRGQQHIIRLAGEERTLDL